jgi:four helix bundle protein
VSLESFKDLIVWQRSIELVEEVYLLTRELPQTEVYGLTSQIRRAAISVPSNIAEGYKRKNRKEYLQFLSIADASSAEVETQLILIRRLYQNVVTEKAEVLLIEVQKMLATLIRQLHAKP